MIYIKNKSNKEIAFIVDSLLLSLLVLITMIILYFTYNIYQYPRYVFVIVVLLEIPIVWGTMLLSASGKKTLGNIVSSKLEDKKNNSNKTH